LRSVSWPNAAAILSASGELRTASLDLWLMRTSEIDVKQFDPSILDAEERVRAATLRRPADRLDYEASHLVLRQLLGAYLDRPPQMVTYCREPCPRCGARHGRPAVSMPRRPLHFSLSRSARLVLIGIASTPVGVDIEALPDGETVAEVSALLHPAERIEISSAALSQRAEVFARIWTRKEAYLKGIGVGVAHELAADYLGTEEAATAPEGWTVVTLPMSAGYAAAAAVQSAGDLVIRWNGSGSSIPSGAGRK